MKRRANNIRALVEQKKANVSPSNIDKPLSSTNTVAQNSSSQVFSAINSVLQSAIPISTTQSTIIRPVRINIAQSDQAIESLIIEAKVSQESLENYQNEKENKCEQEEIKQEELNPPCSQKSMEGTKKHYNSLVINIPGGSEHSEGQPTQIKKEKQKPAKLVSPLNEMGDPNSIPTTKVGAQKSFSFSQYLFDQKSPISPNRTFWVSQFLKQKLGDEKFEKVRELLENSGNPSQLLKEHPEKVIEIIGEEKRDCLMMLSFLITQNTNSATPTGEIMKGQMDKYSLMRTHDLGKNSKNYKSPVSANPFLRNIFPCNTEPDMPGSQNTMDDIRASRKVLSDAAKQKDKSIPFCSSLQCLTETEKE